MKPMHAMFAPLALCALLAPGLGQAEQVYKWVDANGVTNYTTTPPPSNVRKVASVNAAPAISSTYPSGMAANEEAQYWRQRRQLETANELQDARLRREAQALRDQQARQEMGLRQDEEARRRAQEQRRQAIFDQCQRERRVDCDSYNGYGYGYGAPVVVARRPQSITSAAPFPVAGSPAVTNPTPGAPSMSGNATPGAFTTGSASSTRPPARPAREPARVTMR
jgi:hypothetical protein